MRKMITRWRGAARALTALVVGGVAMGLFTPTAVSAVEVESYSGVVQRSAVEELSASEGISGTAARQVLRIQQDSVDTLDRLAQRLGVREVSGYLDARGKPVVNVLDEGAARQARQAGATAKVVPNSAADLTAVRRALAGMGVAHTAVATDPRTNKVVLTVAAAAADAEVERLLDTAERYGSKVRVEHVAGSLRKSIYNGEAIHGGGTRCSAGFNAHTGGQNYIVDAGHCTSAVSQWDVGPSVAASFPGNDYGAIRNDTGSAPGAVTLWNGSTQPIESASYASVGQQVCKSGSTTQLTCGSVQATNVTVNYRDGAVYGLIQTSAYAQPGDSGGCLFSGSTGLGITSGIGGGSSYYQPVVEALNAYGLTLN